MQKNRHRRPANDIALLFTVTNGCACEKAKYHTNTINTDIHYFVCANNEVDYRGSCPGWHYVRADAIEQVVMLELRRMAEYLSDDEDAFAELLARKTDKELLKEQKRCEEELQKAMARNDTVSRLYEKLYEDNAIGKVSDEWFMQLSHKYEAERMELKSKITALHKKLSESGKQQQQRESFILAMRRFMQMDYLTAPLRHLRHRPLRKPQTLQLTTAARRQSALCNAALAFILYEACREFRKGKGSEKAFQKVPKSRQRLKSGRLQSLLIYRKPRHSGGVQKRLTDEQEKKLRLC